MPGLLPTFARGRRAHPRAARRRRASGRRRPGMGWWSDLVGHGRLDCVEIFAPHVERFGLRAGTGRSSRTTSWLSSPGLRLDVRDPGDVLEHLTVEEAQYVVRT